jgi:hypothetical protein
MSKRVTKQEMAMESKMATEAGLVELGKQQVINDLENAKRKLKLVILKQALSDAKLFNPSIEICKFMSVENDVQRVDTMHAAMGHLKTWEQVYNYQHNRINDMKKTIKSLEVELAFQNDYVEEIQNNINDIEIKYNTAYMSTRREHNTVNRMKLQAVELRSENAKSIAGLNGENTTNQKRINQLTKANDSLSCELLYCKWFTIIMVIWYVYPSVINMSISYFL